ncbi:MAG TPA: protoporphyrinogen oxidase [Burkholderiales bacterium]|nr:protoporphyrinogen oxidase [Burkholderiales bacterium]
MTSIDCDVLVVGAGISGLTAAFELMRRELRVEVIDAATRAGGVIGTELRDGFLYERGPNSMLESDPVAGDLIMALGIRNERIEVTPAASKRYVVKRGELVALPMSPVAVLGTSLFSLGAKLRLMREPFIARAPATPEESVSQFIVRRLGQEPLDYAVEPFVAGIYAGNPDELSVSAAFPRLHALEQSYGSLIKGQRGAARTRKGASAGPITKSFSFRNGMQTLTDTLASVVSVRTATRASALQREADGTIRIEMQNAGGNGTIRARAVVLAVPANAAAELVSVFAPDAAVALQAIPYAPVVSVVQAYRRADVGHTLDGFGFLAPRVEKRRILGCLFSSSMFEGRAPASSVLLTTFVGGRRDSSLTLLPNDEIEKLVCEELVQLLGVTGSPHMSAITRWQRAIPQYTTGHLGRIHRASQAELSMPGLFLCAAYRGGVSVGDCMKSAHEVTEKVTAYLTD